MSFFFAEESQVNTYLPIPLSTICLSRTRHNTVVQKKNRSSPPTTHPQSALTYVVVHILFRKRNGKHHLEVVQNITLNRSSTTRQRYSQQQHHNDSSLMPLHCAQSVEVDWDPPNEGKPHTRTTSAVEDIIIICVVLISTATIS